MTFDFFCPTPDCARAGHYAEDVPEDDGDTTPATIVARARVAAMSHGWVPRSALPADLRLRSLLVCPACACDAIDCSRVSWHETTSDRVGDKKGALDD